MASLCGLALGGEYLAAPAGYAHAGLAHAGLAHAGYAHAGYAHAGYAHGYAATVPAGPPVAHVAETYHPGQPIVQKQVQHGVVGHRTVQVGSQPVQVGHEYFIAGKDVHQPAPYSFPASEPVNTVNTVPIAPPALPHAAAPPLHVPPRPVNLGPAPADTVTQEKILAPARAHQVVTPRLTRIEPELHVNKVPVDVPVHVPIPVHREVLVEKRVQRPYEVPVPRAVPVPKPFKVHPVHEVVETPVVHEHTVSHHYAAPAVHQVGYTHQVAAPAVAHAGYGIAAAAPAVATY